VRLNQRAYDHARALIRDGSVAFDDRNAWSEHQPSPAVENEYLEERGFGEYGRWFLGVDEGHREATKAHYKLLYGDFERVHRCGLLAAEARAGQGNHLDIELAIAHLQGMLEAIETKTESGSRSH
jgi:hypothetical protein